MKDGACNIAVSAVMPDGNGGWQPVPEIMTPAEAARFLRIDSANYERTLSHYREKGKLHGTRIGKTLKYTRKELERFAERMTNHN
jgi:hypothetical protein